ncbi:MAG: multicopper oxidase domain-containing protein [Candidatus Nanopelagicales bacterium]
MSRRRFLVPCRLAPPPQRLSPPVPRREAQPRLRPRPPRRPAPSRRRSGCAPGDRWTSEAVRRLRGRSATVCRVRRSARRPGSGCASPSRNDLPEETSVHWHGLAVPNPMDGVPGVTTPAIASGTSFTYDFVVPGPGTHWFHPHTGLQLDTGLYAPFIVEDPGETARYDHDWVLMLDDWTQGRGPGPAADLRRPGRRRSAQ